VESEALGRFPPGKFRNFVFDGKAQGQVERSKADPSGNRLRVKFLAKKDVRERAFAVQMGVGIDKVPEPFGLEATAAVAHPICAGFQTPFLPWGADVIIVQESWVPEMKVDGESVRLDMHQKGGRKIPVELEGLKPLPLIFIRRRNPDEFPRVRDGGLASGKMSDRAEFDS